jgi:hypothetical protein
LVDDAADNHNAIWGSAAWDKPDESCHSTSCKMNM